MISFKEYFTEGVYVPKQLPYALVSGDTNDYSEDLVVVYVRIGNGQYKLMWNYLPDAGGWSRASENSQVLPYKEIINIMRKVYRPMKVFKTKEDYENWATLELL